MNLTTSDIRENVYSKDYKRGLEYFSENRVVKLKVIDEDLFHVTLVGEVNGSSHLRYTQYIDIDTDDSEIFIEGNCSCPVEYNCKHVVALCLKYIAEKIKSDIAYVPNERKLERWIDDLKTATSPTNSATKSDSEYFITYRLFSSHAYYGDELTFYKSKILKNGNLSQGTRLDCQKFVDNYYYSDIKNEDDIDIVNLAKGLYITNRYTSNSAKLSGTLGYILIKEVLKTQRCYFDTAKVPLKFDDGLFKTEFKWSLYRKEYTLKSNIEGDLFRLFDTKPPLILDIEKNIIQEVDIDEKTYRQLLKAPKIEEKDIAKACAAISENVKNIALKTPKSLETLKLTCKPKPQIHLRYTKEHDSKRYSSFEIDFDYSSYKVDYFPREKIKSFYKDDKKIEIHRDLSVEEDAKNLFESFGFKLENSYDTLTCKLSEDNRQHQLKLWKNLLDTHLQRLENEGWNIHFDEEFDLKFEANTEVVVENEESNDWFSLSFNLEFNGISQPIAPLVGSIIEEFDDFEKMPESINIEINPNHFVELKTQQIRPILQTIMELFNKQDRDNTLKVSNFDAHLIANLDESIIWKGSKEILQLSKKLKDFKGITEVKPPKALKATLRDYQQEGLNWLNFLYEFKFGGILADDMGLGKTIQTLAHLSRLKEENLLEKPSLIIMPTSLIANWKNELKKFTPNLNFTVLHGSNRHENFDKIESSDIVLTSYALIIRDEEILQKHKFLYIILDEAQKIKNPKTKMAIAIKSLKSTYRLALSGTPIENHLGELWSIYSFLMPGFLDTLSSFKNFYQTPIEKEHDFKRQELLNRRIKPFMIRRTKERVAHELPSKSEIIKYTQFENKQSKLYESIRVTMEEKVKEAVSKKGIGSSHITILDALLKLRQVCCDPSLLKIDEAKKVKDSAKLQLFLELIDELLSEGRKILVFSQFTSMLTIIESEIKQKNIAYTKLTGSTINRESAIEKFTKGDADIFLISLKAGGVGLNLVEADTVIHYDPWWNPAVENQATDRAHRIGQDKAVFVYKLIVENTIEQKILELQKKKQKIQDSIYEQDKGTDDVKFSGEELLELLK
jgi:SNF2 family DNA or RNA helicase